MTRSVQIGTPVQYFPSHHDLYGMCTLTPINTTFAGTVCYICERTVTVAITDHRGNYFIREGIRLYMPNEFNQVGVPHCRPISHKEEYYPKESDKISVNAGPPRKMEEFMKEVAAAEEPIKPNAHGLFEGTCTGGPMNHQRIAHPTRSFAMFTNLTQVGHPEANIIPQMIIGDYTIDRSGVWTWKPHTDAHRFMEAIYEIERQRLANEWTKQDGALVGVNYSADEARKRKLTPEEVNAIIDKRQASFALQKEIEREQKEIHPRRQKETTDTEKHKLEAFRRQKSTALDDE